MELIIFMMLIYLLSKIDKLNKKIEKLPQITEKKGIEE